MRIKMNYPIGASSGVLNPTRNKKMRLIRGLYGYETVKNDKKYRKKGLLEEIKGEKIGPTNFIVLMEEFGKFKSLLKSHKIPYKTKELVI